MKLEVKHYFYVALFCLVNFFNLCLKPLCAAIQRGVLFTGWFNRRFDWGLKLMLFFQFQAFADLRHSLMMPIWWYVRSGLVIYVCAWAFQILTWFVFEIKGDYADDLLFWGYVYKRLDLTNSVALGYFEFSVISHSILFLLNLLFSHLLSVISNYFSFLLRVRNSRIQLYLPNNLGLTRVCVCGKPKT